MPLGIERDIERLKQGGAASASEVREFIAKMRGRNPQDVLGMVAQSSLVHGVTVATVATVLLMAIFTAGPYFLSKSAENSKPAATTDAPASTEKPTDAPVAIAQDQPAVNTTATANSATGAPSQDKKILEKLDMDETKQADPTVNPLEERDDDLLKELK